MKTIIINGKSTKALASYDGFIIGSSGKKLKPRFIGNKMKKKYHCVGIFTDGIVYKGKLVHKLIWEAYNGAVPDDMELNHKDGDKTNNRLDNLELVTHSENCLHAFQTGLREPIIGEDHYGCIINDNIATKIKIKILEGYMPLQISKMMGVSYNIVKDIKRGKTWKHIKIFETKIMDESTVEVTDKPILLVAPYTDKGML